MVGPRRVGTADRARIPRRQEQGSQVAGKLMMSAGGSDDRSGYMLGHARDGAVSAAADQLVSTARRLAEEHGLSPFVMPEVLLLAAVEMAAQIDGTAEGTIEWIQNVARRLQIPDA